MISVIMSTYKEDVDILRLAIESILNQTFRDFEFIIILDNPKNKEHLQCLLQYEKEDCRVHFYVNAENKGLVASLNKALSLCKGDIIARMDADDIALPNRLEMEYDYMISNDLDMVGGLMVMIDEKGNTIYSISKVPANPNKIKKALQFGQCLAHPTWMVKKKVYDHLNGYRNIPLCEDYDFTLRAALNGYKLSNVNQPVLKYRMSKNSISRSNLYAQYLYMKYITKQYRCGIIADVDQANQYVKQCDKEGPSKRYLQANVHFNAALQNMTDKRWLQFLKNGICLTFSSVNYLNKLYRFIRLSLYS